MTLRYLVALTAPALLFAQGPNPTSEPIVLPNQGGRFDKITAPYRTPAVTPVDFHDSRRLDSLIRAGQLYLSLQDAIALAIENNLDIEVQRFLPAITRTDVLRAQGGGLLRGVTTTVRELPQGVGGPGSPLITTVGGSTPATVLPSSFADLAAITATTTDLNISGTLPLSAGAPIPQFDPVLSGTISGSHQTSIQTSPFNYGVNPLVGNYDSGSFGYSQALSNGTLFSGGYSAARTDNNATRSIYNPSSTGTLGLTVTQPLLQGFGIALNRRYIRIAQNDERIAGSIFQQQLISTVSGVIQLYWDLVSLNSDVSVKRGALQLAQRLFEDNKSQVDVGTLAPLELKRAQAEVARSRQDLINSESLVLQQEVLLKAVLTRTGGADVQLRETRIIPLDHIEVPAQEAIQPVQDLLALAFDHRPDVAQARLQVDNSEISLKGSKNELLPTLNLIGSLQNNGLTGITNPTAPASAFPTGYLPTTDPLIGGTGNLLAQLFGRSFPNYSLGVQLNIPLRNRVAQADVVRDELQVRQTQVRQQQLSVQVRLEVQNALVALQRARASYEAAVETRQLQQEALAAEQERYTVGASTSFFVIQYERDLAQAKSTEVASQGIYAKSKATLDRALGLTLINNNVEFDEALKGQVSRAPSALP
jgi:outer membrane protein